MERAAIFTELTKRNALRKMARLPLLDLRAEMAFAVEREAQRVYAEQCKRFDDDRRRVTDDVLTDLRATRNPF
jgi:rubrerythrin